MQKLQVSHFNHIPAKKSMPAPALKVAVDKKCNQKLGRMV